jgi:replicative DNA helicase
MNIKTSLYNDDILKFIKNPPYSIDAEKGVICGLLLDEEAFNSVAIEGLTPNDFYHPVYSTIFFAMQKLQAESEPINTVTLTDKLIKLQKLKIVGGISKIAQLETLFPTAAHVGAYCRIIIEKSMLRQLISAATSIIELSYSQKNRANEIIEDAEKKILAIRNKASQKGMSTIKNLVHLEMTKFFEMQNNPTDIIGIASGFSDLDRLTSGFHAGELVIVAGRPSMGKTSFSLNIAAHIAIKEQLPVGFFSLEMGSEQLIQRLVSSEAYIDLSNLRRGYVNNEESSKLTAAYGKLADSDIYIDDSPSLSIETLKNKCRRLAYANNVKIIFIDYLQLMSSLNNYDNKATEISEISKGLKAIAREHNIPIVALSQLNRSVELRINKRPIMSDLRESGAIEQDADIVIFLYNEDYYSRDKTSGKHIGLAEIIISKNRNGPTGKLELKFFNNITRFVNFDRTHV